MRYGPLDGNRQCSFIGACAVGFKNFRRDHAETGTCSFHGAIYRLAAAPLCSSIKIAQCVLTLSLRAVMVTLVTEALHQQYCCSWLCSYEAFQATQHPRYT